MITGLKGSSRNYGVMKSRICKSCTSEFIPYHPRQKFCCEECQRIAARKITAEWKIKNPDKNKSVVLKSLYGISLDEYNTMVKKQNHKCLICNIKAKKLVIDHCHNTGKVRGLLCNACNMALGSFDDSVEKLNRAIKYLEKAYGNGVQG